MDTEAYEKKLKKVLFITNDIRDCLYSDEKEEIINGLERINDQIKRLDIAREETMDLLLETETLEVVSTWSKSIKEKMEPMKALRKEIKQKIEDLFQRY